MKRFGILTFLLVAVSVLAFAAPEKVLRATCTWQASFDTASTGSGNIPVHSLIYEWLVRYKGGTAEVEPWLAKSWEISKDNTTLTFRLQQGVQFHKAYGEFTAEDVKFSIERIVKEKLPEAENWKNLDRVEVVDKYTVRLVMKSPTPTIFTIALPFQAGQMFCKKAVEEMGAAAFNKTPIGTGPYEMTSFEVGQSITLTKFNKYWGKRTLDADKVVFSFPSDALTALQAGDLDFAPVYSALNVADGKKAAGLDAAFRLTRFWWISLPCTDPILKDINARKAIRAALDIDAIVKVAGFGVAPRGYAMVPPGIPGYWKDAPKYSRDLAKAKQFLKAAGYPNGFTVPFLADSNTNDPAVEIIRQNLEEVGIKLDINSVEDSTYWSMAPTGKYMTIISYQTLPDAGYTLVWFLTDQFWNTMKWSNKQFDDLYAKGQMTMDKNERAQIHISMQKIMDDDCAMAYVGYLPNGVIFRKGVVDLGPNNEALLVNGVVDTSRIRMK